MRSSGLAGKSGPVPGPSHEILVLSVARYKPAGFFETLQCLRSFAFLGHLVSPLNTDWQGGPTETASESRTHQR